MKRHRRWTPGATIYSVILRQTWALQGTVIGLGLAIPALSVMPIELQRRIIDEALPAGDMQLLLALAAVYLAAVALRSGLKFAIYCLRGWIAEIVARILRMALVVRRRAQVRREGFESLGAATSVMVGEVEPIGGFAAEAINTPLIQGGTLAAVVGYMLATEAALAAIGLGALLAEGVITPIMQGWINRLTALRIEALRRAGHDLALATRPGHRGALAESLREVRLTYRLRLRMYVLKAALKLARALIDNVSEIAVLAIGAAMVAEGRTEIGVVVAFLTGLRRVREPWSELLSFYRRFADAHVKYRLIRSEILAPVTAAADPPRRAGGPS